MDATWRQLLAQLLQVALAIQALDVLCISIPDARYMSSSTLPLAACRLQSADCSTD